MISRGRRKSRTVQHCDEFYFQLCRRYNMLQNYRDLELSRWTSCYLEHMDVWNANSVSYVNKS